MMHCTSKAPKDTRLAAQGLDVPAGGPTTRRSSDQRPRPSSRRSRKHSRAACSACSGGLAQPQVASVPTDRLRLPVTLWERDIDVAGNITEAIGLDAEGEEHGQAVLVAHDTCPLLFKPSGKWALSRALSIAGPDLQVRVLPGTPGKRTALQKLGAERSPAAAGPPRLQVLVLPGNPGFARFYAPFLAALHAALGGSAAVACCSHLGHHCRAARPCGRVFGLRQQQAHAAALLRALPPGGPPVALVGHSLGSPCREGPQGPSLLCVQQHQAVHGLKQQLARARAAAGRQGPGFDGTPVGPSLGLHLQKLPRLALCIPHSDRCACAGAAAGPLIYMLLLDRPCTALVGGLLGPCGQERHAACPPHLTY